MTQSTRNPETEAKDPIESWLDVLVSMLKLPGSVRSQVRDEFEDHLRSRVDDLMLSGVSESDAIRRAIEELGETAKLARHISGANTTRQSFRSFTMNAAFFVFAGAFMTAGISMMMPASTAQSTAPAFTEGAMALSVSTAPDFGGVTVDVRQGDIGNLFDRISEHVSKPVVVHWDELRDISVTRDTPIGIDSDPIGASLALSILEQRWVRDMNDTIVVRDLGEHIEIGSRSQFDHRTRERRIYELASLVRTDEPNQTRVDPQTGVVHRGQSVSTLYEIRDLMMLHVSSDSWEDMGGDAASSSVFETTLVVTAPTRMHDQISALLSELTAQRETRRAASIRANVERIERIREEYERVRAAYASSQKRVIEINRMTGVFGDSAATLSGQELDELNSERGQLEVSSVDLLDRAEYLRTALMELEYQPLVGP